MTIPTETLQGSKKFKRLKKASRDNQQEERAGFFDGEEFGRGDRGGSAEEKLKHSLFGDDEGLFFLPLFLFQYNVFHCFSEFLVLPCSYQELRSRILPRKRNT